MRMRTLGMAILLAITLPRPASADVFKVHVAGVAASLFFDATTSSGGCTVETSGQLVALTVRNDPSQADVVLFLGARVTTCGTTVTQDFYLGQGTGNFSMSGFAGASLSASLQDFVSGETVAINVAWTGSGSISSLNERFFDSEGGVTLDFIHQRSRNANLSGTMTLGGTQATISGGQLFSEVDGDLVVIH